MIMIWEVTFQTYGSVSISSGEIYARERVSARSAVEAERRAKKRLPTRVRLVTSKIKLLAAAY